MTGFTCCFIGLLAVTVNAAELGHYSFDGDLTDSSGNGRHGELTDVAAAGNTAVTGTDKVFGTGAMGFSNDRDYVAIPEWNFPAGVAYTVAFWAKRNSATRTYDIVAGNRNDDDNFLTFYYGDSPSDGTGNGSRNYLRYEGNVPGNDSDRRDFAFEMGTDWHHYAYVSDGAAITIYADGIVIGSSATSTALILNTIGVGYTAALESDFEGKIDEFRVFDTALSPHEINHLMQVNSLQRDFGAARNLGKVMLLGDSITQAAFGAASGTKGYRYSLWKLFTEGGYEFDFVGSHHHNFKSTDISSVTSVSSYPDYDGKVFDPDHEGHWGWRATDVLGTTVPTRTPGTGTGKLSDWLAGYTPDTVFVILGINDIRVSNGASVAATVANLRTILDAVIADNPKVRIYLASVLPTDASFADAAKITALNAAYQDLAARDPAVNFVNIAPLFNPAIHSYDGVHPNALGEQILANAFYAAITDGSGPQSYLEWSTDHALAGGEEDDADRDGISNFLEFAMGSDPRDRSDAGRTRGGIELIGEESFLVMQAPKSTNALGLQWRVEWSGDLVNWNVGGEPVLLGSEPGAVGVETLRYRAPQPSGGLSQMFLRAVYW